MLRELARVGHMWGRVTAGLGSGGGSFVAEIESGRIASISSHVRPNLRISAQKRKTKEVVYDVVSFEWRTQEWSGGNRPFPLFLDSFHRRGRQNQRG